MNRATILEEIRRNVDLLSVTDQPEYQYIPLHQKPSPSVTALREIMTLLRKVIFPGFFGTEQEAQTDSIQYYTGEMCIRDSVLTMMSFRIYSSI